MSRTPSIIDMEFNLKALFDEHGNRTIKRCRDDLGDAGKLWLCPWCQEWIKWQMQVCACGVSRDGLRSF